MMWCAKIGSEYMLLVPSIFEARVECEKLPFIKLELCAVWLVCINYTITMTICYLGHGRETEKYTCPSEPWNTEEIFCCGLSVKNLCCAKEEYDKVSQGVYGSETWELVGHSLSLTLLLVLCIAGCICCFCCPCCPAFRWRVRRGRVIRTEDTAAGVQLGPVTAPLPAPPCQQYPTAGYTAGYQLHIPPPAGGPMPPPMPPPLAPQIAPGYAQAGGGWFPPSAPSAPGWEWQPPCGPAPVHCQHNASLPGRPGRGARDSGPDPPPPYPGTGP